MLSNIAKYNSYYINVALGLGDSAKTEHFTTVGATLFVTTVGATLFATTAVATMFATTVGATLFATTVGTILFATTLYKHTVFRFCNVMAETTNAELNFKNVSIIDSCPAKCRVWSCVWYGQVSGMTSCVVWPSVGYG